MDWAAPGATRAHVAAGPAGVISGGSAGPRRPYEHPGMPEVTGETLRPGGLELTARALGLAALRPGSRVLDVGCGLGATLSFLHSRGFVATGVEPSPALLARVRAAHPELDVRLGRAEALPLEDGAVDAALMECALSVVTDRTAAVRELHRVVRRGGRLLLTDLYRRRGAAGDTRDGRDGCLRGAGSEAEVRDLLRRAGFGLEAWEDHSATLAALAAAIVFAHGSLDAFFACVGLEGGPACDAGGARGLGYFLAVATRDEGGPAPRARATAARSAARPRSRTDGGRT